jgi:hypothetical protein
MDENVKEKIKKKDIYYPILGKSPAQTLGSSPEQ